MTDEALRRESVQCCIGERYHVLEQLGRGGMAIVYRVRDASGGEELALKQLVLREPRDERGLRPQFEQEFAILAELSHPSVIEVHDYGVDSAGPYYTMELLDGGDISALAPMDFRRVCELALQLCSSLTLLHSHKLVHRDISPRNVRCTRQGRAKLIDFGAMTRMGPCLQVVGTPAFVAPEVLHHLALDARTDLFSLGATLYYALTGRKPFAARSFAELGEAWRVAPPPPSELVPAIPPALDALVLSLLRIDPALRPASAFEVIQRLTAIDGIDLAESEPIAEAFFAAPPLVGRDRERRRFRQQLQHALRGSGGSLFFSGEPGLGRTRLLESCVVDAKLAGTMVVRVNGRTAARTPLSGAYAIAEQTLKNLPELSRACAIKAPLPSALFDTAVRARPQLLPLEVLAGQRERALADLSTWLQAICERQSLVIALDDIERVDDASLAWLAGFMHAPSELRRLVVATLSSAADTESRPALHALRTQALELKLAALSAEQSEELFTTMFVDAPHAALLSHRVQRVAGGNPREAMALVRHMLARQWIRYSEGNWILPAQLKLTDLPANAEAAVRERLAQLPPLALRLAQTQALAFEGPWSLSDYRHIGATESAADVEAAIALLVREGVLVDDGGRFTLGDLGIRACLVAQLSAAAENASQLALAELCVHSARPVLIEVHHWLLGGQPRRALDRLMALLAETPNVRLLYESSGLERGTVAAILERAKAQATAIGRRARDVHDLNQRFVDLSVTTDSALYDVHAPAWLAQLEHDSGFVDYTAQPAALGHDARLHAALQRAEQRFAETPEHARVYAPEEARKRMADHVVLALTIMSRRNDMRLLQKLPTTLEPFTSLSLHLGVAHKYTTALLRLYGTAQLEQAWPQLREAYEQTAQLTTKDYRYVTSWRASMAAALATLEVALGKSGAEHWIEIMEREPLTRLRSLDMRRVLCLFDGDTAGAERYRKQAELLAIATDSRGLAPVPPFLELAAYVHAGDLSGVKRLRDRLEQLARAEPNWRPLAELARTSFERLRGDLRAALELAQNVLGMCDPARNDVPPQHHVWVTAAAEQVTILTDLGRAEEACRLGARWCECADALQIVGMAAGLQRALALAEARIGRYARAAERLEALISRRADSRTAFLALDYEARVRVAIAAHDQAAAQRFMRLATQCRAADGKLGAAQARLLDEAKSAGLILDVPASGFETTVLGGEHRLETAADFTAEIASIDCLRDVDARAVRLLELLAVAAGASTGYLYRARNTHLTCAASLHAAPEPALDRFARGYLQSQLEGAAMTTIFTEMTDPRQLRCAGWTRRDGSVFHVALLPGIRGEGYAGLVALHGTHATLSGSAFGSLAGVLAAHWIALGDTEAISLPR